MDVASVELPLYSCSGIFYLEQGDGGDSHLNTRFEGFPNTRRMTKVRIRYRRQAQISGNSRFIYTPRPPKIQSVE